MAGIMANEREKGGEALIARVRYLQVRQQGTFLQYPFVPPPLAPFLHLLLLVVAENDVVLQCAVLDEGPLGQVGHAAPACQPPKAQPHLTQQGGEHRGLAAADLKE
jgi:hypothetical protein